MEHVAVIGGTGPAGKALALRLAASGIDVVIGSRSAERAVGICDELKAAWPDRVLALDGADNAKAALMADLLILATPWNAATETAQGLATEFAGKVVVSMGNALERVDGEFRAVTPPHGSVAQGVQHAVPAALVTAAFHHLPAREVADLTRPVEGDVLVCGNDDVAVAATCDLVAKVAALRPLKAGSLAAAGPIEAFTAVLLGVNVRYKARSSLHLTGI